VTQALYAQLNNKRKKKINHSPELGYSSVVECLPTLHEALGLIPNTKEEKTKKTD
jgi:hypothetical protein